MNASREALSTIDTPPVSPGLPLQGGFYAGRILIADTLYALIVAPKAEGERKPGVWSKSYDSVPDALSYVDGLANTAAMAESGNALAKWAQKLEIGGYSDWYLPAVDELEIIYRHLKPTAEENSQWFRSGINVSAVPPTYPYVATLPAKTESLLFQSGGREALEPDTYWTSTQHATHSDFAWLQYFGNGDQDYWGKDGDYRARAVRRLAI